jgi:hypothetical protein
MKEFCQKKDSGYFGRLPNLLMRKTTPNGGIPKKSDELSNNDRFFI